MSALPKPTAPAAAVDDPVFTAFTTHAHGFAPRFAQIAADAARRDTERDLPHEDAEALKRAGFARLRLPVHQGGAGVSLAAFAAWGTPQVDPLTLVATRRAIEAKIVIDALAPELASALIDLGSGSVVGTGAALDRHWRNIKVISAHNPRLYKERFLGEHLLHGTLPPTGAFF